MTARSDPSSEQGRQPPRRVPLSDGLSFWGAHRMSRRFADVGVDIPAARLRTMAAGAPPSTAEAVDLNFALAATGILQEQRQARFKKTRRRVASWLVLAVMVVASLNLLVCLGYLFISMALHEPPL